MGFTQDATLNTYVTSPRHHRRCLVAELLPRQLSPEHRPGERRDQVHLPQRHRLRANA